MMDERSRSRSGAGISGNRTGETARWFCGILMKELHIRRVHSGLSRRNRHKPSLFALVGILWGIEMRTHRGGGGQEITSTGFDVDFKLPSESLISQATKSGIKLLPPQTLGENIQTPTSMSAATIALQLDNKWPGTVPSFRVFIGMPYIDSGHIIIASSAFFFFIASYAILFSAFLPRSGIFVRQPVSHPKSILSFQLLDALANDTHYKYLVMFIIPVGSYFIIANWVGWQYYRNS
jgi:hypothetical protein